MKRSRDDHHHHHHHKKEKEREKDKSCSCRHSSKRHHHCKKPQPCTYVPYPKMGACCNAGICSIQEERDCLDHGGYWMGVDTRCWEIRCPEEPVGG